MVMHTVPFEGQIKFLSCVIETYEYHAKKKKEDYYVYQQFPL